MIGLVQNYVRWLHTQWPAGTVEKLPRVGPDFSTNVPGVYVVGDLTGVPLLKFSADSGARVVRAIAGSLRSEITDASVLDVAIVGGGVSGMAAALEARAQGLSFEILEASEPFSTIVNFPKAKPIYTYPSEMTPLGQMRFTAQVKEALVEELRAQTLGQAIPVRTARVEKVVRRGKYLEVVIPGQESRMARRVVIAIGRSGNFRRLGVPGEELDFKVNNRLHDPRDCAGKDVLVVGGGDSALEAAIAIARAGGRVVLSYRKKEFSRPKPENVERLEAMIRDPGRIEVRFSTTLRRIGEADVVLGGEDGREETLPNDIVFTMIGREPPLDFFRKSGIDVAGEMRPRQWAFFSAFLLSCLFLYNWKSGDALRHLFQEKGWFPYNFSGLTGDPSTLLGTLRLSSIEPGFWYSLAYCVLVAVFGLRRIRKRKTPYVKVQTLTLLAIQCVPLFLLPYVLLPWMGHNGAFDAGIGRSFADHLFPAVDYDPHGREYWRSVGFILAWPLFVWNVFSGKPLWAWLAISLVQTFVLIPLAVRRWGKGAYCGWICSCGALAETLGDDHRTKMPHGPFWNRLNVVGQAILVLAFVLLAARVVGWVAPGSAFASFHEGLLHRWEVLGVPLNYKWVVDLFLAGVIGIGFYFWFSGRVWCRFACPLAALMHVYARFTRFRILADKKRCISCNVCTSVCHQGIDVMSFANKGIPMADPQCVRCSACVQSCPTGVLEFGRIAPATGTVLARDSLSASPVLAAETGGPR